MAGFDNDTMYADNVDFSGSLTPAPTVLLDGQLLIGATALPHIRVATLTAGAGITITNGAGAITIAATGGVTPIGGLIPDAHTAPGTTPVVGDGSGNVTITGTQVASGVVGTNVIRTDSLAANTMTIEIQRTTTAAASTPADNGVAHFDSSIFTVGAGGFVSLVGGAIPPVQKTAVDANTAPGTNPVLPTAGGVITVTGAQVAAGVVGTNVIRTDSLAANTYTIEIQRSTAAAVATVADNGVSHFDSSIFTVDGSAFVSLVGGSIPPAQKFAVDASTVPGTNPVVPTAGGIVTVTGAQVASGTIGTNVIRTNSVAANAYRTEIQRSTAVAASDITKNGVSHFNSLGFTVDANAFVSLAVNPNNGFMARLTSSTVGGVTGAGAAYTVLFDNKTTGGAFDPNGLYNTATGTFTANATGKWVLGAHITWKNLTAAMTSYLAKLTASTGNDYRINEINIGAARVIPSDSYGAGNSVCVSLTAGDTVNVIVVIGQGAGNTADIQGVQGLTYFWGYQLG